MFPFTDKKSLNSWFRAMVSVWGGDSERGWGGRWGGEGWRMGGMEGVHPHRADERAGLVEPRASHWLARRSDTDPPRVPFTETTEY